MKRTYPANPVNPVRSLNSAREAQLVNYLVATGKPVGLLMNFGESKVDV